MKCHPGSKSIRIVVNNKNKVNKDSVVKHSGLEQSFVWLAQEETHQPEELETRVRILGPGERFCLQISNSSLKVPESYEKCLWVSSSVRKSLSTHPHPSGRD